VATMTWKGGTASASFNVGTNWIGGVAPGTADVALFENPGSIGPYTVTGGATVAGIIVDQDEVVLTGVLSAGALTVRDGGSLDVAGRFSSTGTAQAAVGSTLEIDGTLSVNTLQALGTVEVASSASVAGLIDLSGTLAATSGTVTLGNSLVFAGTGEIAAAAGATIDVGSGDWLNTATSTVLNFGDATNSGVVVWHAPGTHNPSQPTFQSVNIAGGTLRPGDGQFSELVGNDETTTVNTGATLDLAGHDIEPNNLQGGGLVTDSTSSNGLLINGGSFAGTIAGPIRVFSLGSVTLAGTSAFTNGIEIDSGTLDFAAASSVPITGTVAFTGASEELIFGAPGTALATPISNFGTQDRIELAGLPITGASFNAGTVTVTTTGTTYVLSRVSLAPGTPTLLATGIDAFSGDSFIQPQNGSAYARVPLTGTSTLTWNGARAPWNDTNYWVNTGSLSFSSTPTFVPNALPGTGFGTGVDSVALVAGEISASTQSLYNSFVSSPKLGSHVFPIDLFINNGSIDLLSLTLAGFNTIVALGSTLTADVPTFPTVEVTNGATLQIDGAIFGTAAVATPLGAQSASGGGTIDIGTGGTVAVGGSVQPGVVISFQDGEQDTLRLASVGAGNTSEFAGTIAGFVAGDTIDLPALPVAFYSLGFSGGTLTISDRIGLVGTFTPIAKLAFTGSHTASQFSLVPDGSGGKELVTCFAAGTRIRTSRGYVAVEDLREGDEVPTVSGTRQSIVWIGRRHVDCRSHPEPQKVWPVRIRAGAFGRGRPHRDLWLSPDHAVFVDGVLIPVKYLIDDAAIVQVPMDTIDYYHVELPRHDVLLAEGLTVESYLDAGDRRNFDNGGDVVALHPDFASRAWEAEGCAPLVVCGPALQRARGRTAIWRRLCRSDMLPAKREATTNAHQARHPYAHRLGARAAGGGG
jgi:Hint domain